MRLFTAVDLPEDVLAKITALIDRLRPAARIRWSPASNLHITTKFIGEWPEEQIGALTAALASLPARGAIEVAVRRLGFYPSARAPRIFWAGVASAGLPRLAADTDAALNALGIEPEKRAYSPHLTLARIRDGERLDALDRAIAEVDSTEWGTFEARSFFLYRSEMRSGGSVYTKLAEFPLSHP